MTLPDKDHCNHSETTCAYAVCALSPDEHAAAAAHIAACTRCRKELDSLQPVLEHFTAWPTNVLRPSATPQARLARRIGAQGDAEFAPVASVHWQEPDWEQVAPGLECKLLATDAIKRRVSMLVRLAPCANYPAHTHAGVEELHLLDGELWIEQRKLLPGDYNYSAPGSGDERVWSETGCTCVLITSTDDLLR